MSDEEHQIPITDDDLDSLSDTRKRVCVARACKDLGIDYEWANDGETIRIDADTEEILEEDSEFWDRWYHHAKLMLVDDTMHSLERKGYIKAAGIDADGRTVYVATDKETDPEDFEG